MFNIIPRAIDCPFVNPPPPPEPDDPVYPTEPDDPA